MISVPVLLIALVYLRFANAFELKCNFTIKLELYCCEAQRLIISEPNAMITSVSGIHLPNLGSVDVEYLRILEQKDVKYLPINIAEYFPNLKRFVVKHTKLEYITQENLQGLTQLTVLFVTHSKLKELPCGLLDNNRKLQEIHFEDNYLAKVSKDIFKPLPHLRMVHFRNNNCINRDVNETSEMAGLIGTIIHKCGTSCEPITSYGNDPIPRTFTISSACDSKYYNIMTKQLVLLFIILILKL